MRATHVVLGQEVQFGDVLVELDVGAQRLQLEEERARLAALASQPAELRREIKAEEAAKHEDQQTGQIALAQARARYREAEATAQLRVQEAQRIEFLYARAAAAELEFLRATAEVRKNEETINALRLEVGRLERDRQMRVNDRQTRLQRLRLYVTQLEGQIAITRSTIERLNMRSSGATSGRPWPGASARSPRCRSGRGSARERGSARLSLLERSKPWRTSSRRQR